MRQHQV